MFGKPTGLPWALEISRAARVNAGIPAADLKYGTFQPSFLYELIFDLAWAAALVWLGHHRRIRPQGLFALYVAGYSGYRIFEESIRIDSSAYFLGLRLNFFIAITMTVVGLAWFTLVQRNDILISSASYGQYRTSGRRPDTDQEHGAAARPRPAGLLATVAEVEGRSVSDVAREAIGALIQARREDKRFRRLLEDNLARHQRLLDLLQDDQP